MSAIVSTHAYDQLGLDSPIAEGNDEADRYEAVPAWNELAESPYAEASATAESWSENQDTESVGEDGLAWLDVEAESDNSEALAEDLAQGDGEEHEAGESLGEPEVMDPLAASPTARPPLKSSTIGGFGRYRSDAPSLAPAERAKISALAAYVLWSFGPGRERVRSIEFVGHADRDVARGPDFENQMSRERALKMRAVLAEAIDRQSAAHSPSDPPWPPYSSRVDWSIVAMGARRLLVASPRTEAERARNRRVDIALHSAGAAPEQLDFSEVAAPDAASIEWTFPIMLRFSKIVPAEINATNCCRAVQTASRLLEAANPPKTRCTAFNAFGTQLITARESQPPLSSTRKCCDWTDKYWAQCAKEPHKSHCAHCGDTPGAHLVLKYAKQPLQKAVERIKQALDQGCTVAAGVMSGICADKPEVGCARVAKDDAWRQCPEHWVLILAYQGDTFLFWDSSQASALQTREKHTFGLLEYDRETPRLSTARPVARAERMVVNGGGFHMAGYASASRGAISGSQKRFQVLDLRNTAPCPALEANKRCGEYDEKGQFKPRACPTMRVDSGREAEEAGESEFLDDEERDANEAGDQAEDHESFEPGNETESGGTAGLSTQLTAQQRTWILALDRSALERLPDAAKRGRFLQQDWSDVEFPGNVPRGQSATDEIKRHWVLARSLFDAMAGVTPERRVPSTIRFRDRRTVKVPGQASHRLFGEASDAFLRMHAAAKAEGVDLVILSSWRSRARQAAASANQPNPAAVARKASAHMYGLAIDLRMGVPGLPVKETNTRVDRATAAKAGTAAKMGNLVRMYRSPVYKWMSLRAREFGWFPYRNEPWHWEYNPPGLKERFEGATRGELEQEAEADESAASWEQFDETSLETRYEDEAEAEGAAPSLPLRTFTAKALDVKVAVYVTQAARRAQQVEMMVFAHGLDLCKPVFKNRPATFISERPFKLGELVEATGRPIVLVVPFLDWEHLDANRMAFGRKWHRLAQPANFNLVAAEALEQTRAITGSATAPTLQRLILAGHSRAYGFFDALAHEHASPQMRTGALASPLHVWALDTTYSAPIADWRAWLRSREDLQATVVYRTGTYRTKDSVVRQLGTGVRGREFGKLAKAGNSRLRVMPVAAGKVSHCGIPTAYLPRLLAELPALATRGEYEADTQYEEFEQGEDHAGLTTEAEAFESDGEGIRDEWTGQTANEEELDAPDRFDSFGDERDSEWEAQSSEEEQSQGDSVEEGEHDLSFELDQEDESGLAGSGLTTSEQKAVEITSLFETGKRGGFYGLTGNFDGQGLSFGMVNWTMGTGSLQPLLRDFAREHPARWIWTFGVEASRFLQVIARKDKAAQKEQHRFAVEQMNSVSTGARGKRIWTVRQPWVGYFKRLSEDTAFQKIQVRYVRDLLAQGEVYCRQFGLTSEQAFCFMFDAVSSHGKWWLKKKFNGVEKRRVMVEEALKSLAGRFGAGRIPESEVLLAIADVLGTTSAQRWADKVRRRKRWFVTGEHPRGRELDDLRPRANVAYSTSAKSHE